MSWREWIQEVLQRNSTSERVLTPVFYAPATPAMLSEVETALGVVLPDELVTLLKESNGVTEHTEWPYLGRQADTGRLLWSASDIHAENRFLRTSPGYRDHFRAFDDFLFVCDGGNGDDFGYAVVNGWVPSNDIYVWDHEDDRRRRIASSLRDWLEGWYSGRITL